MTHEIIPIEAKDAGTVHILAGTITDVDIANNKADVDIDGYGSFSGVPVFYHCEDDRETANGMPFLGNERVIIVNHGSAVTLSALDMKVIGFEDGLPRKCPTETVYVVMKVKDTQRCFVWKVEDGEYAAVNKNDGDPASFPCDPTDISNWVHNQKSVGNALLAVSDCGIDSYPTGLNCPGGGSGGGSGSSSDSAAVLSNCDCGFTDTGECESIWTTMQCRWVPTPSPGHWEFAGSITSNYIKHILWGKTEPHHHYGSRKISFKNNCDKKTVFGVELSLIYNRYLHWADTVECSGGCDNITETRSAERTYQFNTPIAFNIFTVNSSLISTGDLCAWTGQKKEENELVTWERESKPLPAQLKTYGAYSEKIIVQAYFAEIQIVTRQANCCTVGGICCGPGCAGDSCPWQSETFIFQGLKMVAQADVLDETDGVDPTGLPRNSSFENAISELYNVLRVAESIPSDEIAGARFTGFNILKGV